MAGIINLIQNIFKPAVDLVDALHTSEEEKLQQKALTLDSYARAIEQALAYEERTLQARAKIVESEAQSEHVITATWRPLTMLFLVGCVGGYWFGLTPNDITPEIADAMFDLVKIGLGGYVVGRSAEKTAKHVVTALKRKDEV